MELKVFQKENVSFTEMLEFLIKYLVLFDTSSLYSGKPVVAKLEYGDLYDTCFNSSSPVQVLSGGSQKVISPAKPKAQAKLTQGAISIDKDTDLPEIIEERTRFNDKGFNFKSELLDLLNEGARIIKNMANRELINCALEKLIFFINKFKDKLILKKLGKDSTFVLSTS